MWRTWSFLSLRWVASLCSQRIKSPTDRGFIEQTVTTATEGHAAKSEAFVISSGFLKPITAGSEFGRRHLSSSPFPEQYSA